MDVLPKEDNGEKRVTDFETGSLAHTLNHIPPYSVGWWDAHGMPNDRNMPYLYDFYIEKFDDYFNIYNTDLSTFITNSNINNMLSEYSHIKNRLGGAYCMKIEFDRNNADTENGRLYQSFGTYGHKDATSSWEGYDAFEFDIRADTVDSKRTQLLIILSDQSGSKGKVGAFIESHNDLMSVEDGCWQTITIPLNSKFFDWRYPEGQNGSEIKMDFSAITQIEFVPWSGDGSKQGVLWLDNLRLTRADKSQNRNPVAVIDKTNLRIQPNKSVTLDGSKSYDPDSSGKIVDYRWIASDINSLDNSSSDNSFEANSIEKLSDSNAASPIFLSKEEGVYAYDLVVTDDSKSESINIAQVVITVSQTVDNDGIVSIGGGSSGDGCFLSTILNLKVSDREDFTDKKESKFWFAFLCVITIFSLVSAIFVSHKKCF